MRIRTLALGLTLGLSMALPPALGLAQSAPLPDRRVLTTMNQDFYGADIGSDRDVSFRQCRERCQNNTACKALTYNSKAKACFLKSGVERVEAFEGAISARMVDTAPAAMALAQSRLPDLGFLPEYIVPQAKRLSGILGDRVAANSASAETMRGAAAQADAAGNMALAAQNYAAAATLTDAADDWRDLARVWGNSKGKNASETRRFKREAVLAAVNAYLRSDGDPARAASLNELAERLRENRMGRQMIPALRLSLALAKTRATEARLEYAISNYGFRIVGHTVDSDPVTARICVQFSEDLASAGVDYAPYVRIPGLDMLAIEAKGRDLCADGLVHGERYRVSVRSGLPSAKGETLRSPANIEAYIRDRSPSVRFAGRAYVLPKSADAAIPVVTVNLPEVDIAIHRIGARNLLPAIQDDLFDKALAKFQEKKLGEDLGATIWQGKAEIDVRVNADVTTALPIGEALAGAAPGIYAMTARVPTDDEDWRKAATQWFVVTDLGLQAMAGADGLHGFVRALGSGAPVPGTEVKLLARNNAVLGTGTTDQAGYVRFDGGLLRGLGGNRPAMMIAEAQDDFAFLDLSKPGFDLSDRGVEGRAAPGPVDLFATTERGVYRPGEVVHMTVLARDGRAEAIDNLPLTLVITRPDGVEYARALLVDFGAGGRAHSTRLGQAVPRGAWKAKLYTDPKAAPVKQLDFLVEDFVPERIDFDLAAPDGPIARDNVPAITLNAQYLYGAPGADLPVAGEVRLQAASGLPGFPGFQFGLADETIDTLSESLSSVTTDANGDASLALTIPKTGAVTKPLTLTAIVNVTDSSGRPVERTLTRPLLPDGVRLGIRPLFDGQAEEGGTAGFEIIAVGPDGAQVAVQNVGWTLSKINAAWQWYQVDGRWNWERTTSRERIANGTLAVPAAGRGRIEAAVDWGRYELKIASLEGQPATSSIQFSAGWWSSGTAAETPDALQVGLDKDRYAVGDVVNVRLTPRHAGKLLLAVVDNRLIEMREIDVQVGETEIPLTVTEDWGPGAYVTATLIRPMDIPSKRNPARALGLAWATVDPGPRALDVAITTPDEVAPRGPFPAGIQISGLPAGEQAYVTMAAVDVGILNLTGFEAPDPGAHFHGQRALGMDFRDVYGKLIDGLQGVPGRLRSGGDAEQKRMKAAPPTEQLVAFFSGVVQVGPDGTATAPFEVPDFNGTVKVMAIAWTRNAVGQANKDVLVRDPVVVSAAIPRFMGVRDQARLLLDVAHATGPAGPVSISVEGDGGLAIADSAQQVDLGEGQIQRIAMPITAVEIGDPKLRIRTTTPGGQTLLKTLTLPVRLNDPETANRRDISLPAGGRMVIDAATFAGLEPGTARVTLAVGPMADFDAAGLLQELDRYPYGCTEQTTSTALPLLYLDDVAAAMGLAQRDKIAERIDGAIAKVLARQSSSGAFGLWRPGRGDLWLDAYVSDFLSRAKAKGYTVPETAFSSAIDNLRSQLTYTGDFDKGGEDVAYALLVLAREGAASIGDLRYYADVKAEALATPMAKAQLGAALALYGEQVRADRLFQLAQDQVIALGPETRGWRADYGSHLRDGAAVLALAAEARSSAVRPDSIINAITSKERRWTSTQEKTWMLMATAALAGQGIDGLTVNGTAVQGPMLRLYDEETILNRSVVIKNESDQPTRAVLTTYGVPTDPGPADGNGYELSRDYFTPDGVPVSPELVAQNDRLVVVLTVTPQGKRTARLMVDDPLPAGFEIDNPRLLKGGSTKTLGWLQAESEIESAQFLSERFLAAVDHSGTKPLRLAYIVRAVSPGRFHHPAAVVEDMYRPDFRAWTSAGSVEIVAR